jgi:hypothetical protein
VREVVFSARNELKPKKELIYLNTKAAVRIMTATPTVTFSGDVVFNNS